MAHVSYAVEDMHLPPLHGFTAACRDDAETQTDGRTDGNHNTLIRLLHMWPA